MAPPVVSPVSRPRTVAFPFLRRTPTGCFGRCRCRGIPTSGRRTRHGCACFAMPAYGSADCSSRGGRVRLKVFAVNGVTPVVDPTAFVHPSAVLIGDVIVGPRCYVGPAESLRGDFGRIERRAGANVSALFV